MRIAVVGLGKLGSSLAAVLATQHRVIGVDLNPKIVDDVNVLEAPVYEPGLQELMGTLSPDRYWATSDISEAVSQSDLTFVIVPTPSDRNGVFDSTAVCAVAEKVGKAASPGHVLVVSSTVMPGAMESDVIPAFNRSDCYVAYSPMLVALGDVIQDIMNPEVVFIGANDHHACVAVHAALGLVVWDEAYVAYLSLKDAELAKLAVNAYVTAKISFANVIAEAAEKGGGNAYSVLKAIGHDSRIGSAYLKAGGPFGGPCFPRDSVAMAKYLEDIEVPSNAAWATQIINEHQVFRACHLLRTTGRRTRARVAILGLAYKPGTPVWEESFGVKVASHLGPTQVAVHDPMARPPWHNSVIQYDTAQEAVDGSEAVLIACAWPEYAEVKIGDRYLLDPWKVHNGRDLP